MCLTDKNIKYKNIYINCPSHNYIPKVKYSIEFAKQNNFKYIMKCDNDIIIPSYTIDYIIENLNRLNNPDVLTISPTITTGIPSCEYFINDFLSEEEAKDIREEFAKCKFDIQGGIMDYRFLNKCTIENTNLWNYNEYFSYLNNYINNLLYDVNNRTKEGYCKFYKGIHPIRHGFGNDKINNLIIKYKKRFFENKKCEIFEDDKPYLCDMCFVINTENYDKLINKLNLLIDGCDEVPLNRLRWDYNLKNLIIKNGFAIHITYNWMWHQNSTKGGSNIEMPTMSILEYEKKFIEDLYKN